MTMMKALQSQEMHVYDSLQQHVDAIDQVASGEWRMLLHRSADLTVTVRTIGDAWLVLTAPLPSLHVVSLSCEDLWTLLEWNGTLPGGVRFALLPDTRFVSLQTEIAVDRETNLTTRVAEACAGFHAAWIKIHKNKEEQVGKVLTICASSASKSACDLPLLCREAEWPFTERPDGRVVVELDAPRETAIATLTQHQGKSVHIAVALALADALVHPCRQALGLVLLTVCGVVRMIRAVVEQNEGRPVGRFEVDFGSTPTATELAHALSALSVAVRLCGRELQVLQHDERIATEYLTLWQMRHGTQTNFIA